MSSTRLHRTLLLLTLAAGAGLLACAPKEEDDDAPKMSATAGTGEAKEADEADEADEASEALAKEAKVAESDARATALAAVPGGAVKDFELEREDGALIYSYDISVAGKTGIDEVHVDAMTGKVLSNKHETPEDEAAEAAEDSAKGT